ncbi:hypothetical protein PSPO01_09059 [Paraphaeosphaeria sporulosa]
MMAQKSLQEYALGLEALHSTRYSPRGVCPPRLHRMAGSTMGRGLSGIDGKSMRG